MPYIFGLRPTGITTHAEGAMIPYVLAGQPDWLTAKEYAIANTPATFSVFFRKDLRLTNLGAGIWNIDVEYAISGEPQPGDYKWTFDTTGETQHVTQGLQHIATYPVDPPAPFKHYGAIGVTDSGVEGVDIPRRAFKWTETWQLLVANYGFFYSTILGELTGRVNATYFRGFPAYTVRFDGASGGRSSKDAGLAEITFNFAVSPSETGLVVGDITGINKFGWDYLWVRYQETDDPDKKRTSLQPVQVEIDRLFTAFNFSLLGIGTGILS